MPGPLLLFPEKPLIVTLIFSRVTSMTQTSVQNYKTVPSMVKSNDAKWYSVAFQNVQSRKMRLSQHRDLGFLSLPTVAL